MMRGSQAARRRIGGDVERSEKGEGEGVLKKMLKLPTTKGMTW